MKTALGLFFILSSQIVYGQSIESNINLLARKINTRAQYAHKLSQDEKIQLVKALNNADAILSRVAEDGSNNPPPIPGQHGRSCDSESISEMTKATAIVKNFAYSSSGLNMYSREAEAYAIEWAKQAPCSKAQTIEQDFRKVYEVAYSVSYMNMSSSEAIAYSKERLPAVCSGVNILSEYKQSYDYAYSVSGLNMNSTNAKNYAKDRLDKIAFSCRI